MWKRKCNKWVRSRKDNEGDKREEKVRDSDTREIMERGKIRAKITMADIGSK